ncbi:phosphotransferase [Streptomyces qinglanensis]|uniref:phosphotransferase n=1 Tax=Streptomyces qinglanensis TaxID=943816 RepID=UPI003D74F2AE
MNTDSGSEDAPERAPSGTVLNIVGVQLHLEDAEGRVLLGLRHPDSALAGDTWHFLAGRCHQEGALACLVREAQEEAGLLIHPERVELAHVVHLVDSPRDTPRMGLAFRTRAWQGTPRILEPQVCDAMEWFALDDRPSPMVVYCRAGLDSCRTGARVAVHFQQPGDAIACLSGQDRLRLVPATEDPTDASRPEARVRRFAEQAVGRIARWTDTSWARESSRVRRAHGAAGGTWYVKVHLDDRFHDREVAALRTWVPHLGGAAPKLVAADTQLRAVVVTAVPGRPPHGAALSPREQWRLFHRIGALASAIHRSAPAQPAVSDQGAALEKVERHLHRARPHLASGDKEFLRALVRRAQSLPGLARVPTHGDFQLRNLLLDGDGSLAVIDFERSEPGPAIRDIVRLCDTWAGRPDLYDAFFAGYGRRLTPAEEERLTVDSALDAVSGIQYGAAHGDPEVLERGLRTLARLRAQDRLRCNTVHPA